MADTTDTTAGAGPDPMKVIEELVATLKQDLAQRSEQLGKLNDLIDRRNELIAQANEAHAEKVRSDLEKQMDVERQRNKRAKWYTGILGVFAVLMGGVLFLLVVMMALDMDDMEAYMYNMGHSDRDGARAAEDERKAKGPSYMFSMAEDMRRMRADMGSMNTHMTAMSGDMGQMRGAMLDMDATMGAMGTDIGQMSTDMTTMNASMGRMQYDVLLMRQGVGNMASDTGSMSVPFRAMDQFIPFR
ncbi:hypothetical protein [uncultured Thiohalocapsa sp.]|uniref:hypothetical protein n=1 Tax=uncultured Thiohalocapsa sp. TaxID=768990 RepID=UPI0025F1227E|nr:hypothetical protein [uncultured Thiohalocapsa sp.]